MGKNTKKKTISKSINKKAISKKVIKKVAPKKVTKKVIETAPKKTVMKRKSIRRTTAKKRINKDQYFYLKNGNMIKDIEELAKVMDQLEDEIFYHHVSDERNDFANWIHHVFEEAELAKQLLESKRDKEKNHYIILKYVIKTK